MHMPIYVYKAKDANGDCDCCHEGIELRQDYQAASLRICPQCGRAIRKVLSSFSIGLSRTGLDHRAKEKGLHKLKRLGDGEYERVY